MPFVKGQQGLGGRKKGVPNKNLSTLRQALTAITEAGVEDFNQCLADVRETNPGKYLEIYLKLLSYSVPQLRQTDLTMDVGEDTLSKLEITIKK